jgi:hypothetical protein
MIDHLIAKSKEGKLKEKLLILRKRVESYEDEWQDRYSELQEEIENLNNLDHAIYD